MIRDGKTGYEKVSNSVFFKGLMSDRRRRGILSRVSRKHGPGYQVKESLAKNVLLA